MLGLNRSILSLMNELFYLGLLMIDDPFLMLLFLFKAVIGLYSGISFFPNASMSYTPTKFIYGLLSSSSEPLLPNKLKLFLRTFPSMFFTWSALTLFCFYSASDIVDECLFNGFSMRLWLADLKMLYAFSLLSSYKTFTGENFLISLVSSSSSFLGSSSTSVCF